jgi:predicted DNA-binding protein (MmcQ/YjbR family)
MSQQIIKSGKVNVESIRDYCLSLKGVVETFPFGNDVIVFKVNNKMFLLLPLDTVEVSFNVKCDPEYAMELREQYSSVQPGYHMNKKHWNTITVDGSLSNLQLKGFIDDSYKLVSKTK